MPLLILREGGRWQRLEDEWSDVRREKLEKQSGWRKDGRTDQLDIEAGPTVEPQKDQSGHHCMKPEYSKAPARIKSKTASPRIFSRRRALDAGFLLRLQFTIVLNIKIFNAQIDIAK